MGTDWFDLLTSIISYGNGYLWSLYTDIQSTYGKVFIVGLMGTFTLSQVTSNLISFCFLLVRSDYLRDLLYIFLGKYIGIFVSHLLIRNSGYWFYLASTSITNTLGPAIILLLLCISYLKYKQKLIHIKSRMLPLAIGFIMSFYIDPVLRGISIRVPFLTYSNVTDVVFPLIYTFMLVLPLLLLCLIIYGFELDLKLQNKPERKKYMRYSAYVLSSLIAVNEIIIYWF